MSWGSWGTNGDSSLEEWRRARRALAPDPDAFDGWKDGDWEALRTLCQEFGGPWGTDKIERARRELVVSRHLASLPAREVGGVSYPPAWSLGAHLAALRRDRERSPVLYQGLEPDDTLERYQARRRGGRRA